VLVVGKGPEMATWGAGVWRRRRVVATRDRESMRGTRESTKTQRGGNWRKKGAAWFQRGIASPSLLCSHGRLGARPDERAVLALPRQREKSRPHNLRSIQMGKPNTSAGLLASLSKASQC